MPRPCTEAAAAGAEGSPFVLTSTGLRVRVRVTPRARRAAVGELRADAGGRSWLAVAVTEPAEDGRANAALLALLAREWRLPKRSLSLLAGAADRRKTIGINGDPAAMAERLDAWLRRRPAAAAAG